MYEKTSSEFKAAESAEKADYYRKTLEHERASREQADKQVIDLLHDVRNRYDQKINSYMAKNKNKPDKKGGSNNNAKTTPAETANDGWGTSNDNTQAKTTSDGWGATTTTNNDSTNNADEDWGSPAGNDNNNTQTEVANDGWGDTTTNQDASNNNDDGGWGATAADSNQTAQADTANSGWGDGDWGNKKDTQSAPAETAADDGWGTSAPAATPDPQASTSKDNWGNTSGGKKKGDKKKSPEKTQSHSENKKQETKPKKIAENEKKTEPEKHESASSSKQIAKDKEKDKEKDKDKKSESKSNHQENDNESKEFKEMKSQLWTAKLDLRLVERDKSKIASELSSVKDERDDLYRKHEKAKEEQDTLKMKVRGLTVDLVSANDEIHKLNEKIDELEAQRTTKDRDVFASESKRKSIESRFKSYQQQIADLRCELEITRENKDEAEKKANDLKHRNERLENDLAHSKNLIRTLKDGCAFVESQAKTFEVRHDTIVMSKADMERELIAIKEESSRHITTIGKLQKSNEAVSKAFLQSVEAHDQTRKDIEKLTREYARRLDNYKLENLRLNEANSQLRKLLEYLQKKR